MQSDRIKMVQELSRRPGILIRFNSEVKLFGNSLNLIPAGVLFLHILLDNEQVTIDGHLPFVGYTTEAMYAPLSKSIMLYLLYECTIIRVCTTLEEFEIVDDMVPEN